MVQGLMIILFITATIGVSELVTIFAAKLQLKIEEDPKLIHFFH